MAVLFLLLAVLVLVVLGAVGLENSDPSSATLLDRSFDQLSEGQLLLLAAGLGFLVATFLFLAFGASRTRRSRRKELKSRRRDAEGRVDELERENARLQHEVTNAHEKLEAVERGRSDAVTERDRAEASADRLRSRDTAAPAPASVRRERLDDRTEPTAVRDEPTAVRDEHAGAADEHAQAADQHARAADEEARRR